MPVQILEPLENGMKLCAICSGSLVVSASQRSGRNVSGSMKVCESW